MILALAPSLAPLEAGQSVSRPSPSVVVSTQTRELGPGKANPVDTIKCRVENALPGLSTHRQPGAETFWDKTEYSKRDIYLVDSGLSYLSSFSCYKLK